MVGGLRTRALPLLSDARRAAVTAGSRRRPDDAERRAASCKSHRSAREAARGFAAGEQPRAHPALDGPRRWRSPLIAAHLIGSTASLHGSARNMLRTLGPCRSGWGLSMRANWARARGTVGLRLAHRSTAPRSCSGSGSCRLDARPSPSHLHALPSPGLRELLAPALFDDVAVPDDQTSCGPLQ